MPVFVVAQVVRPKIRLDRVRADARTLLAKLDERKAEITVVLVGDTTIRDLNRRYRRKDTPTDVLAFAAREGMRVGCDEAMLGDIIISLETAARRARHKRKPLHQELRTLLIHGLLHLVGYDHERSPEEARRMRAKERELARALTSIGKARARD